MVLVWAKKFYAFGHRLDQDDPDSWTDLGDEMIRRKLAVRDETIRANNKFFVQEYFSATLDLLGSLRQPSFLKILSSVALQQPPMPVPSRDKNLKLFWQ